MIFTISTEVKRCTNPLRHPIASRRPRCAGLVQALDKSRPAGCFLGEMGGMGDV